MRKDNQGGRRRASKAKLDDREAFKGMVRLADWTSSAVESQLLPISKALAETTHKARLAQQAGAHAELERLWVLLSQQRLQITLAQPLNGIDVLVLASTAMSLAEALPMVEGPEAIQQAAQELLCALGAIRRFHEVTMGISSEALGLNGRPLQQ